MPGGCPTWPLGAGDLLISRSEPISELWARVSRRCCSTPAAKISQVRVCELCGCGRDHVAPDCKRNVLQTAQTAHVERASWTVASLIAAGASSTSHSRTQSNHSPTSVYLHPLVVTARRPPLPDAPPASSRLAQQTRFLLLPSLPPSEPPHAAACKTRSESLPLSAPSRSCSAATSSTGAEVRSARLTWREDGVRSSRTGRSSSSETVRSARPRCSTSSSAGACRSLATQCEVRVDAQAFSAGV
jgi:hypothetical protein